MIALLLPHTGAHVAHAAQHAPLLAGLPLAFRQALRLPWRKRAATAVQSPAVAATPPDGFPILRDRMLSEVRRERDGMTDLERWTLVHGTRHSEVMSTGELRVLDERLEQLLPPRRPVNWRSLGTLPRRDRRQGKQPWLTQELPACRPDVIA